MHVSKRARKSQACLSCRQRKVKCDWSAMTVKCLACDMRKTECFPQDNSTRHGDGSVNRPESASRSLSNVDCFEPVPSHLPCFSIPAYLIDQSGYGSERHCLSFLSPGGSQWLKDRTGVPHRLPTVGTSVVTPGDEFQHQGFIPFPKKDVTLGLLRLYFKRMHSFCPMFNEDHLISDVERLYSSPSQLSAGNWTRTHAVLALACTLDPRSRSNSWLHFKSAISALDWLIIAPPTLCSVQALLAMALFLIGYLTPQPASNLVSLAIRIIHTLDRTKNSTSTELFNRLLAISHSFDIDLSLRLGIPPASCAYGTDKQLPMEDFYTTHHHPDLTEKQKARSHIYRSMRELTAIKSDIYRKLYSTAASEKVDTEILTVVSDLDHSLQNWRYRLPSEYRPLESSDYSGIKKRTGLYLIYLHFIYYNCLLAIHRKAVCRNTWATITSEPRDPKFDLPVCPSSSRVFVSAHVCMQAARASMGLVRHIPSDNTICAGTLIYFPVFALIILSMLIAKEPQRANAKSDLELMGTIEKHFRSQAAVQPDKTVQRLLEYCSGYRLIAERAIERQLGRRVMAAG